MRTTRYGIMNNIFIKKLIKSNAVLLILLALVIFISLNIGTAKVPILSFIISPDKKSNFYTILYNIRLPRILLAAAVGASLSCAGVAFQGLLRNPLADPYIIGTSAGAALGAAISIILFPQGIFLGFSIIPLVAFLTAMLTMLAIYHISKIDKKIPVETFLLSGIMMGAFMWSLVSFIFIVSRKDLPKIIYWLMGSLSYQDWPYFFMLIPYLIIGSLFLILYSYPLNILSLGEEKASHLGMDIEKTKLHIILAASLLTAAAVSASGLIGFVGLMIPHILRTILGPDHRVLIPSSILFGAIFLILADDVAKTIISPSEVPVGIITSLVGVPFFFYLLKNRKKSYKSEK